MRKILLAPILLLALFAGGAVRLVQDACGPFTDVSPQLCPYVLEMYYLGITAGTSATTFSPDNPVTRGQAAVFVSKGINQTLARSSRRAALGQWWTTQGFESTAMTAIANPVSVLSDGADLWVASPVAGTVTRVRASDARVLETWTGLPGAVVPLSAMGRIFVSGSDSKALYAIDPSQAPGTQVTVATLESPVYGLAFDGSRIWTSNLGNISIVTPQTSVPWSVVTVTKGIQNPDAILFDGRNVWVADEGLGTLLRLDSNGAILQSIPIGTSPASLAFDGANIWVTLLNDDSVLVIASADGSIRATLTGNGLDEPNAVAFDGERMLVTSFHGRVSLWRAADLSPLGTISTVAHVDPVSVCSDGLNFWVVFAGSEELGRF
jgi:hypothetical protein